jgi:hypothetical protein
MATIGMSKLFEFFHLIPFLAGLAIGILYIVMGGRGTYETIYKYPHPTTVDALVYKDPNGACYRYKVEEVNCDKNEKNLKEYPLSG